MQSVVPLACFLSVIRPPGVQYENALLQIAPVDKAKCPFVKDSSDIAFQLYTRHNPTTYQELMVNDDEHLFASNMDFNAPTVIYFHAFMEQPDDGSGIMVREAYMQRGDSNVIMVDAHRLEAGPWYFTAAQNTWYIGRFAARFIDYMVSRGLNLNNTHLVGHSLGAQAAGVAGAALTTGRVSRITGLDPALPLFSGLPLEQRLDPSDADFVDVIHTDAGIFGYKEPIGHVDFYPNGGQSPQPGCELEVVIPQQLLLNKCDGTEQTRGFYTYYLTQDQTDINQKKPDLSGYNKKTKGHKKYSKASENGKYYQTSGKYLNLVMSDYSEKKIDTKEFERVIPMLNLRSKRDVEHTNRETLNANNNTKTNEETSKTPKQDKSNINTKRDKNTENTQENDATKLKNKTTTDRKTTINKEIRLDNAKTRPKRFLSFFKSNTPQPEPSQNFIFKALDFLVKKGQKVVPIISVVRDVNTLVKSANGELNHKTKESNNYVGVIPPVFAPISYKLELGNENKIVTFIKKLLGKTPKSDKLTVASGSG